MGDAEELQRAERGLVRITAGGATEPV